MPLNPPFTDWKGKRCWIVGASTGIGAALADLLAKKGARVALSARRVEPLKAMAARYGEGNALVLPLDITDAAALESAAQAIDTAWGGLDLVVPMAGEYKPMRATEIDLAVARTMIEVNLMGYLNVCAAVVPRMLRQKSEETPCHHWSIRTAAARSSRCCSRALRALRSWLGRSLCRGCASAPAKRAT